MNVKSYTICIKTCKPLKRISRNWNRNATLFKLVHYGSIEVENNNFFGEVLFERKRRGKQKAVYDVTSLGCPVSAQLLGPCCCCYPSPSVVVLSSWSAVVVVSWSRAAAAVVVVVSSTASRRSLRRTLAPVAIFSCWKSEAEIKFHLSKNIILFYYKKIQLFIISKYLV